MFALLRLLHLFGLLATAGLLLVALAGGAWAHGHRPELGIAPVDFPGDFFELELAAGETRELTVELANHGAATVVARTYAADVYSLINGGMGVRLRDEASSGATGWVTFANSVLELRPGQAIHRTFTVSVPEATAAGAYLTALVIENDQAVAGDAAGESVAFDHIVRQAIAVAVTVPGPTIAALTLGDAATHHPTGARSAVRVPVSNHGGMHLRPAGELTLHAPDDTTVTRRSLTLDAIYAATSTDVEVVLTGRLAPGDYLVDLTLADADHDLQATAEGLPLHVPAAPPHARGPAGSVARLGRALGNPDAVTTAAWLVTALLLAGAALAVIWRRPGRRGRRGPGPGGTGRTARLPTVPAPFVPRPPAAVPVVVAGSWAPTVAARHGTPDHHQGPLAAATPSTGAVATMPGSPAAAGAAEDGRDWLDDLTRLAEGGGSAADVRPDVEPTTSAERVTPHAGLIGAAVAAPQTQPGGGTASTNTTSAQVDAAAPTRSRPSIPRRKRRSSPDGWSSQFPAQ